MSYRKVLLNNIKYFDNIFYGLAHNIPSSSLNYCEGSDENLLKWECIDDRFSTYFGSTYEVPVNDFSTRDDNIIITIFGDTWLHLENISYSMSVMSRFESLEPVEQVVRVPFSESLPEVLRRVYPNATVNLVGDFSSSNNTFVDLDDVLSYLTGLSTYPDYFIFNGADKTLVNDGMSATIDKIKEIDNFLSRHNIKSCCVFTATDEVVNLDDVSYIYGNVISTPTKMMKFSTFDWASHHLSMVEFNYADNGGDTEIDTFFSSTSSDLLLSTDRISYYFTENNLDSEEFSYKELVYIKIKRFILKYLFELERDCFYISFTYKSMQGGMNAKTYDKYFGWNGYYNHLALLTKDIVGEPAPPGSDNVRSYKSKYSQGLIFNPIKITGQYIAFYLHTNYSEYLWAWQQGQSNNFNEFLELRDYTDSYIVDRYKVKSTTNPANLLKVIITRRDYDSGSISLPVLPGTGCPMITISEDNLSRYHNKLSSSVCPIELWITRDNYTSTVSVRLHTELAYPDLYQSIEFGKMTLEEGSNFLFPLYCGGGSSGLASDIYSYTPRGSAYRTHIEGNVYDFNMDNICMSNSNIIHPTKFYNSTFSNFKILTPEGVWRSVYAHQQSASVVPWPANLAINIRDYAIHLNTPTHNVGNNLDSAYPFFGINFNTVGSCYISKKKKFVCNEPMDKNGTGHVFNTALDSIKVAIKPTSANRQCFSYGIIPYCWRAWNKEIPSGEFECGGKKYLVIPCGWEERLWDYGWHLDIYKIWRSEDIIKLFEDSYYGINTKVDDKLIIELGDIDV